MFTKHSLFRTLTIALTAALLVTAAVSGAAWGQGRGGVEVLSQSPERSEGSAKEQEQGADIRAGQSDVTLEVVAHFGGNVSTAGLKGNYAFLAQSSTLSVVDVSGAQLQQVATLTGLAATPARLFVAGDYVYASYYNYSDPTNNNRLEIVRVADPLQPALVGSTVLAAISDGIRSLYVAGNYAYVAAANSGFQVVDVSNPTAPAIVGSLGVRADDVFVAGSYAYVTSRPAGSSSDYKLLVLNVATPTAPAQVGSVTIASARCVFVAGNYAYVGADYSGGLTIVDVTTPASPTVVGSYGVGSIDVNALYVLNNYAYLGTRGSFLVLNVATPSNPTKAGELSGYWPTTVYVAANLAYVTASGKFQAINVADPANPAVIKTFDSPTGVRSLTTGGSSLYVVDGSSAWRYDLTSPGNPAYNNKVSVGSSNKVLARGNTLYVADWNNRLYIYDVTDPANPQLKSTYMAAGSMVQALDVYGRYAFLALYQINQLEIVDVNDPLNPVRVAMFPLQGAGIDVSVPNPGNTVYVANSSLGLQIIDVTDPAAPTSLSATPTGGKPTAVQVSGTTAFIGGWTPTNDGWFLQAFDVSNKSSPTLLASTGGAGPNLADLRVLDNLVVTSLPPGGIQVFTWVNNAFTAGSAAAVPWPNELVAYSPAVARTSEVSPDPSTGSGQAFGSLSRQASDTTYLYSSSGKGYGYGSPEYSGSGGAYGLRMTRPPAIAASKTAQPAFYPNAVAPGEEMTYTISLTWNGAGDAASTMSDAIPPYSDYVPGTAHATLGSVGYVGGADDGSISWTGTIPSGQTAIITFRVKVDMSELPVSRLAWPTAINNSASGQIGASSFSVARSVYLFNPTVNTTADTVAGDPHDGICGQDAVPCSLREALEEVNYHPNVGTSVDTISFNIPVGSMAAAAPNASPVISVTSVLPTVAEAVILDGTTQAGGKPEINGSGTPAGTHGLNIAANGSVVQGLAVKGFSGHGVLLNGSQNTIGGTAAAAGNVIANNGQKGVVVASGTRNSILGNAIYGNGVFAIDLGNDGLTLNDLLDADSGANNLQNFPLVLGVQGTVITGSLNSAPTTAYRIELFSASTCVAGGSGQAEQYLGAVTVNTGSVGEATFTFNAAQAIPQGWQVSATATDQNGNTSELTPCPEALVFKVDNAGNVYADGAYQLLTADFAESWDLTPGPSPTGRGEAEVRSPEPGDVLALGPDGGVVLAGLPGAGAVIGVYASQPGLLAGDTEADGESNTQKPRVPVAMMGIVAVKVSADNGPIHPGDLLGLSATPGVAARARPISFGGQEFYLWGTFFGKALEGFDGTDVGMIRILLKRR